MTASAGTRDLGVSAHALAEARQSATTPMLSFVGITKMFDSLAALAPIDASVSRGEFVSILGPSGCGKSTLLRIATGLETATSGVVDRATPKVGYVFQEPALMPWRTVRRNVELLGELEGMAKAERSSKALEMMRLVGLEDFADYYPRTLSAGMKMRASLARSLLLDPELFLFDEPFAALDQITRRRLNVDLSRLFSEQRFAAMFVTHSVDEAVFMASRILVMSPRPGRIIAEFEVPFDIPRRTELIYDSAFATFSGRVASALQESS